MTSLYAGCTREEPPAPAGHGYQFSTDWFSHNVPSWRRILGPYEGNPDLRYLEIGVFEGRSQVTLQQLPPEYFDIIYIDGSHAPAGRRS